MTTIISISASEVVTAAWWPFHCCLVANPLPYSTAVVAGILWSGCARDSLETIISVTTLLGMATGTPASVRTMVRMTSMRTTVPCSTVLPLCVLSSTLSANRPKQGCSSACNEDGIGALGLAGL